MNEARRHHDMGGLEAGPVDHDEHDKVPWEKRVDALMVLLGQRRVVGVDELRRGIEELGADAYDRYSYYERWMASMTNILLKRTSSASASWASAWRRSRPAGGTSCNERPDTRSLPPAIGFGCTNASRPGTCARHGTVAERPARSSGSADSFATRSSLPTATGRRRTKCSTGRLRQRRAVAGVRRKTKAIAWRSKSSNTGSIRSRETRNERARTFRRTGPRARTRRARRGSDPIATRRSRIWKTRPSPTIRSCRWP